MKITENNRLYLGQTVDKNTEKHIEKNRTPAGKLRIHAAGIGIQSPLDAQMEEKRATAMEKAKKLLSDVLAAEKSIDDDLSERAKRIKDSEQAIVNANKELAKFEEEKEKLKEQYGITGEETESELPAEYKMQRAELSLYGKPYHQVIK